MQYEEKCCECNDENGSNKEDIFPRHLQISIDKIIKKEGYVSCAVTKRMISTEGGNYLGILYEVDLKGKTADGDKETNIFIKSIIPSDNMKIMSVSDAYLKESYAYKELANVFTELQNEANIPDNERYKIVKSYDESDSEAIFLENLSKKGFKTFHRMDVVPVKFAELAVQQLAKFHGLSFALQKKRPKYFENNIKPLKSPFVINDDWKLFTKNMCEMSSASLNNEHKKKVLQYVPIIFEKFPQYFEEKSVGCLCHGDYRANNVMMRKEDGEVIEVIPVDYQLMHYGNPLLDFIYFIFGATDQQFRRLHLDNLKNLYYDSLDKYLRYFDLDISSVYPRKEFDRQYAEKLDYGLMVATYLLPFCFAAENDVPDIGRDEISNMSFNVDKRFEERMSGIVDDFVNWGYL